MSTDPHVVGRSDLVEPVRGVIADVLMVSPDEVRTSSALIGDLGAESIDFLDLVYRIEDIVGRKIAVSRWDSFIHERLPGQDLSRTITTAVVIEFAERERDRPR